jgi:hypothetical protein
VRLNHRFILSAFLLATALTAVSFIPRATAQEPDEMLPEESAAKAKEILKQAIAALGGQTYLNVHDVTCTLRYSQFGHSGDLNGFAKLIDYSIPPLKDRTENVPKRNQIEIMNGDKGWVMDLGGITDATEVDISQFQDSVRKDIDNILRHRLTEPGMIFRYGGPDIVDLQESDWVDLVDSENRTIKIAVSRLSHLPIRKIVVSRDANTRLKRDEIEYYSNYHPISGIQTPFQITRERNGMKVYQAFFESCEYNTNLSDSLFTKESLEERWAKVGKKDKKHKDKSD